MNSVPVTLSAQSNASLDDVSHLGYKEKTNLGSFYTPVAIVDQVYDMVHRNCGEEAADVILETSCGYGAFLAVPPTQAHARLIGADFDPVALDIARAKYPQVTLIETNSLTRISRAKFSIGEGERLLIVGNPPYNDVTSHVKNHIKAAAFEVDEDVRSRDLGLSFLLSFAKLEPALIAVLHPLSYLIKEANFKILCPLMRNYRLRDALVFNSQTFSETSKLSGFPIVIALYERNSRGTTYSDVFSRKFETIEGASFSLSEFDYVARYISKYPSRTYFPKSSAAYRFYTMRDINALKRSRTFIREDTANAIRIAPEKLSYYCYVDAFKEIAGSLPYYLGNFDVMFDHAAFTKMAEDFVVLSASKHPHVLQGAQFNFTRKRCEQARESVRLYFDRLLARHRGVYRLQN